MPLSKGRPRKTVSNTPRAKAEQARALKEERRRQIEARLADYYQVKESIKTATAAADAIHAELVEYMTNEGVDALTSVDHDTKSHRIKATLVKGTSIVIDEGRLMTELGTRLWTKVTSRTLDRKKLDTAIADGTVDPSIVAHASSEKPRKPYVRLS